MRTVAPRSTASSMWSITFAACGSKITGPTSTAPARETPGPWRSARTLRDDEIDEAIVDGVDDVHPLDRDAGLAAVHEAVVDGGVRRPLQIGIGADDHRVLPAELERVGHHRVDRAVRDLAAGLDRPGEVHEVDVVDERGAHLAITGGDEEHVARHPHLAEHLLGDER